MLGDMKVVPLDTEVAASLAVASVVELGLLVEVFTD